MRSLLCLLFVLGCDSTSGTPPLAACSAALPTGGTVTKSGDAATCSEAGAVMLGKTSDLAVEGYTKLSEAWTLTGPVGKHGLDVLLPFKGGDGRTREFAVALQKGKAPAHVAL